MESLPVELCLKIFCCLDHQDLAAALQVCRKWKVLASDGALWSNLFRERWGEDRAISHAPAGSESWKDAYEVQDRRDRVGQGLKIIREGENYYLVCQGKIQRYLGSRTQKRRVMNWPSRNLNGEGPTPEEISSRGILDRIIFFIGDLEVASSEAKAAKRSRVL
ncbi:F-box/WD repeat-containing protein 7-like [Punica granatum]|uniref:F-box protein n=2 Tax=Punica granatum TaxID=22663 RepID=A0A2I0JDZ9_PUNGR|nr:F-box/WD repeat-containing protein 7-like [Punica granatum]PKI53886.1 hypothetical protein CRG98_025680 [Punica granatum]